MILLILLIILTTTMASFMNNKDNSLPSAPPQETDNNDDCPVCLNKKIVKSNCLSTLVPELAKQWHPTKNGNLKANEFARFSNKKVWWKCDKGEDHEWESIIRNKSKNNIKARELILANKAEVYAVDYKYLLKVISDANKDPEYPKNKEVELFTCPVH